MRRLKTLFLVLGFSSSLASAQSFSFGLRGGVPLTDAFSDATYQGTDFTRHVFSNSKEFALGPMVELRLPFGLSVEADALYRRLNLNVLSSTKVAASTNSSNGYSAWEFPVLGKLRVFPVPFVKPYVEAGPAFRATGSTLSNYFSKAGFSLGVGCELKLLKVYISPDIRYTHWGKDSKVSSVANFIAGSNSNQAEFLIGVSF